MNQRRKEQIIIQKKINKNHKKLVKELEWKVNQSERAWGEREKQSEQNGVEQHNKNNTH